MPLKQPVLGICSGMQILFDYCVEGEVSGLGIFKGIVEKLAVPAQLLLPHEVFVHWHKQKRC